MLIDHSNHLWYAKKHFLLSHRDKDLLAEEEARLLADEEAKVSQNEASFEAKQRIAALAEKARAAPGDWQEPIKGSRSSPTVQLFAREKVDAYFEGLSARTGERDELARGRTLHKAIRKAGTIRRLETFDKKVVKRLEALRTGFPNFIEAIDFALACSVITRDRSIKLPPILLDGPPGCGKTLFTQEFARALGTSYDFLSIAGAQSGSRLAGSDEHYVNAKPGLLVERLILGSVANPLIVLDELDKAAGDERFPVTGTLYQLLERQTATMFEDLSIPGIPFDASHIIWIATSNDASLIEGPIRDRLRRFDIPALTREQSIQLARRMYEEALQEVRPRTPLDAPGDAVFERLARVSPRRMHREIREAIGRTLYKGRDQVVVADLPQPEARKHAIGFCL